MGIAWQTQIAPIGGIVALTDAEGVPAGREIAGYAAPGWRIDLTHKAESRIVVRHGSAGVRTLAPLVGPEWKGKSPIEIWVVGYAYNSGKIGPYHPVHWSEPGEFVRVVGSDLREAQGAALDAAEAQGLKTIAAPIVVVRADNAFEAQRAQANKLIAILAAILALWLLASYAAVRLEARRAKRGNGN